MLMQSRILILGGGPAGISAWLTCHARGLDARLITNPPEHSNLAKAEQVDNYPGFAGLGGKELLAAMYESAGKLGLAPVYGRATSVLPMGSSFMASVGPEVYSADALILATGIAPALTYPGESEFLGRGVSYCATCDGMLYRGRKVAVIGLAADAEEEAQFLRSIGCEAEYFDKSRAKRYEILGTDRVTALKADGVEYPAEGVFILRDSIRPASLLPGLETEGPHIRVDAAMKTSIPGVFAAGDCTGRPYQIARAAGQGNIAALSAADYVKTERK